MVNCGIGVPKRVILWHNSHISVAERNDREMADDKKILNVLVTGGSEGVGLAVTKALLHKGHNVVATATDADGALAIRRAGALPVYPDLTRAGEVLSALRLAKADVVVHAAPQIMGGVPQSDFDYQAHLGWLVDSTNAVVQAAGQNEVSKIVSISFGYLYDGHHGDAATEDTHTVHDKTYDPMFQAEAAVLDGGIDGYVVRTGYIYGSTSGGTTNLVDKIKASQAIYDGGKPASWVYEGDLANAIITLVEAESDGNSLAEIVNVAGDQVQSPNDFGNILGETLGITGVKFASPGFMMAFREETMRDKLMVREIVLDTTKIKEKYGWQPQYPTIASGLEATSLVWRMNDATTSDDYYNVYEDKAADAILALQSGQALQLPAEVEEVVIEKAVVEKKAPAKAAAPVLDGPTPSSEGEAKMEARRLKALERKRLRAEKKGS